MALIAMTLLTTIAPLSASANTNSKVPSPGTSQVAKPIPLLVPIEIAKHPAPADTTKTIRVKKGQTLSTISKEEYGNSKDWPLIFWANHKGKHRIRWADEIYVGQLLTIPQFTRHIPKAPRRTSPVIIGNVVTHIAQTGSANNYNTNPAPVQQIYPTGGNGIFSYTALENLWVSAGGPAWAEAQAAQIAECESGGKPWAYNPSGASGLWQILGQVVPGYIFNPYVNALNAVSKFKASGDTFAQWVCQ